MKKITLVSILFLTILNSSLFASNNKNVLIINSYHRGFQWSDQVIAGIEKVLDNTKINVNVLYMDSKRISSLRYYKELKELYQLQLQKVKYDLVVVIDKFAYEFALQKYKDLFKNEKIYFVGIEQYSKNEVEKYNLLDKVSGRIERRAIEENIKIILKVIPKLKKLYIINDKSKNGNDTDPFIQKVITQQKSKIDIEYIRESTFEKLSKKFSQYKKNEAIFFIRFYNDENGNLYKNSEIANFIDSCNLPVFSTDTLFIKKGSIGGKLVNINQLGIDSGKDILSILNNKSDEPFIKKQNKYEYIFDYEKEKKFNLDFKTLDKKFTYVNSPKSFFDKHRKFIDIVFIISPFFVLLILGLIHNLILKIQSSKLLKQRIELDKILLNAIDNPIVWQDHRGKIVSSNTKFKEFKEFKVNNNLSIKKLLKNLDKLSIEDILKPYFYKKFGNNELIIKDRKGTERIYIIHQTKYIENIYKTEGTVTVLMDITKERQAVTEKSKQQEFIIQQSKLAEIGEIFSSIAHQWKSPLVEIATIAQEQVYNKDGLIDEVNNKYVNDIMIQVKYMTETINSFQKFIMPSNKKYIFNIGEAIDEMLEIISHNMKYNYINVKVTIAPNTNLNILGYKNELMQIFLNIVNNAKDSIIKRRIKEEIKVGIIHIFVKNMENSIQIEIEDNGEGIKKENLNMIFEPYFTTKQNGHGIGLYMAKLIIEDKFNGHIEVKNTVNGAKFIIKLESFNENISS